MTRLGIFMIPFTALCLVTGITIHIRHMEENEHERNQRGIHS